MSHIYKEELFQELIPEPKSTTTAEEVRDFFHERASVVYRNRKLDNPTRLILSTVRDWFPPRRVLKRRDAIKKAAEEIARIQRELAESSLASTEAEL